MVHLATSKDKHFCRKCKSKHVDIYEYKGKTVQACLDCGQEQAVDL
ncbi:MAG: hypothetical protein AABX13_03630 [Nanoarchaeota archaeon]